MSFLVLIFILQISVYVQTKIIDTRSKVPPLWSTAPILVSHQMMGPKKHSCQLCQKIVADSCKNENGQSEICQTIAKSTCPSTLLAKRKFPSINRKGGAFSDEELAVLKAHRPETDEEKGIFHLVTGIVTVAHKHAKNNAQRAKMKIKNLIPKKS